MTSIYDLKFGTNHSEYESESKNKFNIDELDDLDDLGIAMKNVVSDPDFNELYEIMRTKFLLSEKFTELTQDRQLLFMIKFYTFSQAKLDQEKKNVANLMNEKIILESQIEELKKENFKNIKKENEKNELEREAMRIEINELKSKNLLMKEQIEELTEKYENAKRKKNQYESLANKSSLLKSSIEEIEKEKKDLAELLEEANEEISLKTTMREQQKMQLDQLKMELTATLEENKKLLQQKEKLEVLYARYASQNPLNEEEQLNGVSLGDQFDLNNEFKTEKNEIKVTGKIILNNVKAKNNPNIALNNNVGLNRQKEIEIMETTNKYPIKIDVNAVKNLNSNFESNLTVDENENNEEIQSQKSEEENNYIHNAPNIDYESYNSLMYEAKNYDTKISNVNDTDDFASLNKSEFGSSYQTKQNMNTNKKEISEYEHGTNTNLNTNEYETNEFADPKY